MNDSTPKQEDGLTYSETIVYRTAAPASDNYDSAAAIMIAGGACPVCVLAFDKDPRVFGYPPFHPNCRCYVVGGVSPR